MEGYTKSGIIGRPSQGTEGKGRALLASLGKAFCEHLRLLDPHTLPSA